MHLPGTRGPSIRSLLVLVAAATVTGCTNQEQARGSGAEADTGAIPADRPASEATPREVTAADLSDWDVRLDDAGADAADFRMIAADTGLRVTTGPAGIAWRALDLAEEGDFSVSATFTEVAAPAGHREAYGILVGGRHLKSPDREYTYFLARGTGDYLVKRREGDDTRELVGWTPSPAVESAAAGGDVRNRLGVSVRGDSVDFMVNGETVATLSAEETEPWGLAGIRVNHRLDVRVRDWSVRGGGGQGMD